MSRNYLMSIDVEGDTGEIRAIYFQIRKGKTTETKVFQRGDVIVDYDSGGTLLGIEMIAPAKISTLEKILRSDPESKEVVRRSVPREMVSA
jgi:hypothetical protein